MTTLADATSSPLAIRVGVWPVRPRLYVYPLTLADWGFYERNARTVGGKQNDPRLMAWLSVRRGRPGLSRFWFAVLTFGRATRVLAAFRLVNASMFLRADAEAKGNAKDVKPPPDPGRRYRAALLHGIDPIRLSAMSWDQAELLDDSPSDGPPIQKPKWGSVKEWRAYLIARGQYDKIKGKGIT